MSAFPTYVRRRQTYGPVTPSSGAASPSTATARFGLGVTQSSTYILPAAVAAGSPFALTVWGRTTGLNSGTTRRLAMLAAAGYSAHRCEVSSTGIFQTTLTRSSGTATQTLAGTGQGPAGSLVFLALSFDGTTVTQWLYQNGTMTALSTPATATVDGFDRLQVGDTSLPVAVEQAAVWQVALDDSMVQRLLRAPVDPANRRLLASAADLTRLSAGRAYTNAGTGSVRLLTRIPALITAGRLGTDPAGTTHVVQTPPGTGLTVGQTLASGWGVALQILAVAAGSGATADRYACQQF